MGKETKEVVVYAVVDLSCCCRLNGDDDDDDMDVIERILLHSLKTKLKKQAKKRIAPSKRLKVVVVGCVGEKKLVRGVSMILDRILSTLNMISNSDDKLIYTKYVLLDQKRHGKVIKAQGVMASDDPPEDITGVPLFMSSRQCITHTFTDKRSWWGSTAGQLAKSLKWTNTL